MLPEQGARGKGMEIVTARLKLIVPDLSARAELARIEALPEVACTLSADAQWERSTAGTRPMTSFAVVLRDTCPVTVVGGLELEGGALSYFLSPQVWGLGYAKEAVSAICNEADRKGGGVLCATVIRGNWPSMRVLESNGFRFEGLVGPLECRSVPYLLLYRRR